MKNLILSLVLLALPLTAEAAFDDVPTSHPFHDAIMYLQDEEMVQGYADNTYRPEQTISRAEFTKILLLGRYSEEEILGCTASDFTDVPSDAWFVPYVCFAKTNSIIQGYADNTFGPQQNIIYAEAAKIIVNTLIAVTAGGEGEEEWWQPFVNVLEEDGATPDSIAGATHEITRGEMAEIIYRLQNDTTASEDETDSDSESATQIFDGQGDEEQEGMSYYESDTGVRFGYAKTTEAGATTSVIEDGSHTIVATTELQTENFDDCAELGFCSEVDGTRYEHLDSVYLLTKNTNVVEFEDSILNKIAATGKNPDQCQVIEIDEAPEGWTKAVVEPIRFDSFVIDYEGMAYDNENVELSDYQMRQLREQESVEKCTNYAGGFGGSFFLFSTEKSDRFYLFVPSYGDTERLIDYESIEF